MILKKSVSLKGLQPQILVAVMVANEVYKKYGKDLVITSVNDSKHGEGSLHYKGFAIDTRIFYFPKGVAKKVRDEIASRLGDEFDVVLEKDHIHIEYDPKG